MAKKKKKLQADFNASWLTHLTVLQGLVEGPCVIHPEWSTRPKGRYPKGGHIAMSAMAILGRKFKTSKHNFQQAVSCCRTAFFFYHLTLYCVEGRGGKYSWEQTEASDLDGRFSRLQGCFSHLWPQGVACCEDDSLILHGHKAQQQRCSQTGRFFHFFPAQTHLNEGKHREY